MGLKVRFTINFNMYPTNIQEMFLLKDLLRAMQWHQAVVFLNYLIRLKLCDYIGISSANILKSVSGAPTCNLWSKPTFMSDWLTNVNLFSLSKAF